MVPWRFNFAGTVVEQVEALTFIADMEKNTLGPLLDATQSLRDMWAKEDGGGDMMLQLLSPAARICGRDKRHQIKEALSRLGLKLCAELA
jgi:hypothetical protein